MIRKYPRTRHILGSHLQPGDEDLNVVSFDEIAGRHIVVEEKMDGANCAISFADDAGMRLQSRGHFLTGGPRERHFNLFKQWAATHEDVLFDVLGDRYVMYGEWMYAKHTVFYDQLPHYFLEFDVLDTTTNEFLDTTRRRVMLAALPIVSVRVISTGILEHVTDLTNMVGPSAFKSVEHQAVLRATAERLGLDPAVVAQQTDSSPLMEGLYVKVEEDGAVKERLKFVRADFTTQIIASESHWLDRPIIPNVLAVGVDLFGGGAS